MTTIKWQGAASALDADLAAPAAGVSLYVGGSRVRVGPADSTDAQSSLSSGTQARLIGSLANALSGALSRLDQRLDAVAWPAGLSDSGQSGSGLSGFGLSGSGLSGARLVSVPAAQAADLSATLNPSGLSSLEERLATRPRNGASASGLAAGTYGLTLSLGGGSETLSISLGARSIVSQVYNAVASAVNASSLAVGASVRTSAAGSMNGLQTLALAADASLAGQDVGLAATGSASNTFANWLGLSAANVRSGSSGNPADGLADVGVTNVTALATAKPTRYASQGFDPEAPTTLAPGSYTLDYLVGPTTVGQSASATGEQGSVSIQVSSGDTWRDVLSRMARVLGSSSPALVARLVPAKRVWDLPGSAGGGHGLADAVGLEVLPETAKTGWRLKLSGADAASRGLLDALGLNATAQPGTTGRAVIDGQARESATGTFSADSGRLSISTSGTFGEAAPVRVSEGATGLADALAEVLAAYNEVGGLLARGGGELKPGVAESWTALAASRADALRQVGVERASQALWLSEEAFLTALLSRPGDVEQTLLGADGLLPALKAKTSEALAEGEPGGVADWVSAQAAARAAESGPEQFERVLEARTEAQVEKSSQLLDLYDASTGAALDFWGSGSGGGLLRRKG